MREQELLCAGSKQHITPTTPTGSFYIWTPYHCKILSQSVKNSLSEAKGDEFSMLLKWIILALACCTPLKDHNSQAMCVQVAVGETLAGVFKVVRWHVTKVLFLPPPMWKLSLECSHKQNLAMC